MALLALNNGIKKLPQKWKIEKEESFFKRGRKDDCNTCNQNLFLELLLWFLFMEDDPPIRSLQCLDRFPPIIPLLLLKRG